MTFKLNKPNVKLPARNSLFIILASLVVVAVLAAAIVHFQNTKRVEAAQADKARLAQVEKQRKAEEAVAANAKLQSQVIQSTQAKVDLCNYIAKLPKAKAVPLPAQCK